MLPLYCRTAGLQRKLFPDAESAHPLRHHLGSEAQDSVCGDLWAEAARVDVGDEIAVGVGVRRARLICHVGGQTLGGGEARAFADQQDCYFWGEQFADFAENADSAVANRERIADSPAARSCSFIQQWQESGNLCGDCRHREAVTDSDLYVALARTVND